MMNIIEKGTYNNMFAMKKFIHRVIPDAHPVKRVHKFKIYPSGDLSKMITASCYASMIVWNGLATLNQNKKLHRAKELITALREQNCSVKNAHSYALMHTIRNYQMMKRQRNELRDATIIGLGFNVPKEKVYFDFNRRKVHILNMGVIDFELIYAFNQHNITDVRICLDTLSKIEHKRGLYIMLGEHKGKSYHKKNSSLILDIRKNEDIRKNKECCNRII